MGRGRPPKRVDPSDGPGAAFAYTLRARRLEQGLTLAQVAHQVHCSLSTLGEYEREERLPPAAGLVKALAITLQLPAERVLGLWFSAMTARAGRDSRSRPQGSMACSVAQAAVGVDTKGQRSFHEIRTCNKTTVELIDLAGTQVGRYTFQPGWRWSECVKQVAETEMCQVEHIGYVVSGALHVEHEDGTIAELEPGHACRIAPGHDAWTVGCDPVVFIDFQGAARYAKA